MKTASITRSVNLLAFKRSKTEFKKPGKESQTKKLAIIKSSCFISWISIDKLFVTVSNINKLQDVS